MSPLLTLLAGLAAAALVGGTIVSYVALRNARDGYEDEDGFHYVSNRRARGAARENLTPPRLATHHVTLPPLRP